MARCVPSAVQVSNRAQDVSVPLQIDKTELAVILRTLGMKYSEAEVRS